MPDRYFSAAPIRGQTVILGGPEAHHLRDVVRAKLGDHVILFDGCGGEYSAAVVAVRRSEIELRILERIDIEREAARRVSLAVALPKGERQRWLVEKAVELGVTTLTPLVTARGVTLATPGALERLRRAVIEASKQCGRNRLMEITPPSPLAKHVRAAPPAAERWFAHPQAEAAHVVLPAASNEIWLAIGPEGGFTNEEYSLACDAAWRAVSLGPRILRIETAAIALAALVAEPI